MTVVVVVVVLVVLVVLVDVVLVEVVKVVVVFDGTTRKLNADTSSKHGPTDEDRYAQRMTTIAARVPRKISVNMPVTSE